VRDRGAELRLDVVADDRHARGREARRDAGSLARNTGMLLTTATRASSAHSA
jgi:hypothetical protein